MRSEEPTLESELEQIRTLFLQMCVRAESMVEQSVRAVFERDPHLARHVVGMDREVDNLEIRLDSLCLDLLARRQPVGHDLRLVVTVIKMVTDVERIGDLAVNVAERSLHLDGVGLEPGQELRQLADLVVDMLRSALQSFVSEDVDVARGLIARDNEVDELNRLAFERWTDLMMVHADQVNRALAYAAVSKRLERIGDHAVNLAKMVVFLVGGVDIRHGREAV